MAVKKKTFFGKRKKKKKTFLNLLERDYKRFQKRLRKKIQKVLKRSIRKKKHFYKMMKNGAQYFEIIINVLFIATVFVLFWKKSRDPEFLSDFGATKL